MASVSTDPISAEDEATKRNTDCVYFLASPLTCKKGSECEYRHSESARMNPRDCWYWLNGNCLNPKCSFRHPPLDGFLGTSGGPTSAGSSGPAPQIAPSMPMPVVSQAAGSYGANKQNVVCFYFQKGHCLKGDRCSFLHGPLQIGNMAPAQSQPSNMANPVTERPQNLMKTVGIITKCTSELKLPQVNLEKSVEVLPPTEDEFIPNNELLLKKNMPLASINKELHVSKQYSIPVINGNGGRNSSRASQQLEERYQNGREGDEFLRESSPGFDVLVDNELEDSNYYHNEDELERNPGPGGRDFNKHGYTLSSEIKFDKEPSKEFNDYDQYGRSHNHYGWEHNHLSSSERVLERSSMSAMERRGVLKPESPDKVDRSDLRYMLSKQRNINGSKLASGTDLLGEYHKREERFVGEQRHTSHSRRDQRHFPHETSRSSRLQGRLKLPERPQSDDSSDVYSDRENERGRNRGRLSPDQAISSYQGGHYHGRLNQIQEDFPTERRSNRGSSVRREGVDTLGFEGPKSLAELKGAKVSGKGDEQTTNSAGATMKVGKVLGHQEPEESLSFEGPKPLSVILKRKRAASSENGADSASGEESNQRQKVDRPLESKVKVANITGGEEPRATVNIAGAVNEDGLISAEGDEFADGGQSLDQKGEEGEVDEGNYENIGEDQECEAYDQRDGEDDYEIVEGGEYKPEDEYYEDEDEEDFARKIGVMMS
ncbi:zinc finger CCCH domain-containing protein 32-like [Aristolochia californica]|uniref:zinc finger CCCH domain-containing protein 32-like n=1 Tax=Aristolochia californica TaxID=171875 RepID=UPI0035E0A86B